MHINIEDGTFTITDDEVAQIIKNHLENLGMKVTIEDTSPVYGSIVSAAAVKAMQSFKDQPAISLQFPENVPSKELF